MTKGNTLVILTPAFATEEQDTWLPFQTTLVRALNDKFPKLKIIILSFHFPIVPERRYSWNGNQVIAFNGGMKKKLHSLWRWKSVWKELSRLKERHHIVGLFSVFCSESAFIGHYFARRHSLMHLIWVLGQDARKENPQVRRIRPAPEELVAISDFLVREFQESHGIRPAHMIPVGVDTDHFPAGTGLRDIDLIGAGTLSPIKQYDVFIDVVKDISRSIPGIQALICGGGSEYDSLKRQAAALDLEKNLRLTGTIRHPEMLATMQRSRILLHTSAYEGFGMVCAEALYAGAHVISFCKPLDAEIEHWHVVGTKEEMAAKALSLLQEEHTDYSSIISHTVSDAATRIMELYGYRDPGA